ncbi:hypothetical protein FocTR4_00008412 [Fusarium oxysporum f. sp. cubense]|uniref:Uncharacterized protein n=1 Tax=Fusarium oxysporum f. sp. cubense TaxID=61366 RepID=A0A5C6SQF6_FUSOC|nr:hypothetical protein FocTR4_00008412 [Fusarium oxysporum f. sp. cubense]
MSLKTVRPIYKSDFVDEETLETLYDQVLVEIYERAGVTSFLRGHLPNYHKATRKMLMSDHGLLGADYSRSPPNYRTFRRQAERVSEVEKAKLSPAWLNLAIKMPKYQNETLMNIINPEVKVLMRDEKRVSSDSFNGWNSHHAHIEVGIISQRNLTSSLILRIPLARSQFFEWMEATGDVMFVLKRNHRARRHAAEFVIEAFCGRDISIVYRDPTEVTTSLHE